MTRKKAAELDRKLKKSRLSLADFLDEMREMKKMGDISQIASMLPGGMGRQLEGAELDPKVLNRSEAIILSMTPYERENPNVLDASRKRAHRRRLRVGGFRREPPAQAV